MQQPGLESSRGPRPATIRDWEEACASLEGAVSHFLDLANTIESQCVITEAMPNDLVIRIDSKLHLLQTTIDDQLTRARLALARSRNKVARARSIQRLPEEILADIFLIFVYDPYEENKFVTSRHMNLQVELIYRRVHTLLGVCNTWRNIAISCGALWSVIPIVDPGIGRPRTLSTGLSLQRASNRDLHLALFNSHRTYHRIQALAPRLSQFDSINISSDSMSALDIHEVIDLMLKDESPKSLRKLSLKHGAATSFQDDLFNPLIRLEPGFLALVKALSALRISGMSVAWDRITLSSNLTEFWISGITLEEPSVLGFFAALASVPQLERLTIISARAILDDDDNLVQRMVSFPKLESVHFESLPFNFLEQLYSFIAPGSYRLTLNPCDDIHTNFPSEEMVEEEDICELLASKPVYKLVLAVEEVGFWESKRGLRQVLRSTPTLKVLVLNFYDITRNILKALVPPSTAQSPTSDSGQSGQFPKIETLEIHAATFRSRLGHLKPDFSTLLDHHPIKRLILGGMVQLTSDIGDSTPLKEEDEAVPWFQAEFPQFYVSSDPEDSPDFIEKWQLWDI